MPKPEITRPNVDSGQGAADCGKAEKSWTVRAFSAEMPRTSCDIWGGSHFGWRCEDEESRLIIIFLVSHRWLLSNVWLRWLLTNRDCLLCRLMLFLPAFVWMKSQSWLTLWLVDTGVHSMQTLVVLSCWYLIDASQVHISVNYCKDVCFIFGVNLFVHVILGIEHEVPSSRNWLWLGIASVVKGSNVP